MMQSLKPIKHINQHVCTFALYSHDMTRQIETHHYVTRLNQDFLQCAVYDSDDSTARLIGVEYIISGGIFESLSPERTENCGISHAHEIKIRTLGESPGSRNGYQARTRKPCQDLRQVLVHLQTGQR
ncbi:UNVERIFIED_CONTAM: Oil body-associated protein 2A [Sesamum latifolium]|uniref:Oil body-associated protein 2A n=1 Tax=Sesamum latifolium TaxID=2727402 RepID=A0AAW2WPZ4_9LAMI